MSLLQAEVRKVVARLRVERLAQGVEPQQLAEIVGMSHTTISHVESGSLADPKTSIMLAYLITLGGEDWLERALARPSKEHPDYLPDPAAGLDADGGGVR